MQFTVLIVDDETSMRQLVRIYLSNTGISVTEAASGMMALAKMLTARGTMDDKITGFAVGADDYLVKPFDGRELVARVSQEFSHDKRRLFS